MTPSDSDLPLFRVHSGSEPLAGLTAPRHEGVERCSYRVIPIADRADEMLHRLDAWNKNEYSVCDLMGQVVATSPAPNRESIKAFCARQTDRLSFQSLPPSLSDIASPELPDGKTTVAGNLIFIGFTIGLLSAVMFRGARGASDLSAWLGITGLFLGFSLAIVGHTMRLRRMRGDSMSTRADTGKPHPFTSAWGLFVCLMVILALLAFA